MKNKPRWVKAFCDTKTMRDTLHYIRMHTISAARPNQPHVFSMPTDTHYSYRYAEGDGNYTLQQFDVVRGGEITTHGRVEKRPAWLTLIVNTAKVGDYVSRAQTPPPEFYVWFYTDEANNLMGFENVS